MSKTQPLVSIGCIAYNQEKFIRQTLDSFLMQKTNFPFEILIHDDASTDSTADIIREYEVKYPDIIKPIYQTENQFSQGINITYTIQLPRAKGKYIALCEGDDYWVDETKLQRQVDFMESNPGCGLCFHPAKIIFEKGEAREDKYPHQIDGFSVKKLLKENYIQTNSVMYRRQEYIKLPTNVMPGDWFLHLYHAQFGDIGFINKVMSVYRRHEAGIWWDTHGNIDNIWKKYGISQINLFVELLKIFRKDSTYIEIINENIAHSLRRLARIDELNKTHLIKDLLVRFPEYINIFANSFVSILTEDEKIKAYQQHQIDELTSLNNKSIDELKTLKKSKLYNIFKKASKL